MLSEPTYPQHPGGAGKAAHVLASSLVARGRRVHLVSLGGSATGREVRDGVDVYRIPQPDLRRVPAARQEAATAAHVLAYLRERIPLDRVDVVHDFGGFLSYYVPVERTLREKYGLPIVVNFQFLNLGHQRALEPGRRPVLDPSSLQAEHGIEETGQCAAVRIADLVVCLSLEEAALVRRLFRPGPGRLAIVPNAVALPESSRTEWRARLAPNGEPIVAFGGRLSTAMKGADIVARAFARILAARPEARLLLLSSHTDARNRFGRFGASVISTGWMTDSADVSGALAAADVLVMPSRYEPYGLLCAEALTVGVPVVASPVGGLREAVRHGYNGYTLSTDPRRWESEMAAYVLRILADPREAARLKVQARRDAARRFAPGRLAARIDELHGAAMANRDAAPIILPARLEEGARARYLGLLERAVGPEGSGVGEVVLAELAASSERRCRACTRGRLAREGLALVHAAESVGEMEDAVRAACPVGLLQRQYIAEG